MAAYMFANVEITDPVEYEQYKERGIRNDRSVWRLLPGARWCGRSAGGRLGAEANGDPQVCRYGSTEGLVPLTRISSAS